MTLQIATRQFMLFGYMYDKKNMFIKLTIIFLLWKKKNIFYNLKNAVLNGMSYFNIKYFFWLLHYIPKISTQQKKSSSFLPLQKWSIKIPPPFKYRGIHTGTGNLKIIINSVVYYNCVHATNKSMFTNNVVWST